MQLGNLLTVWAHPDDETWLAAGLMSQAVEEGRRAYCVTATRGELGSFDEEKWPTATMGDVREKELETSLEILGVKEHEWLGYPDAGCQDVDQDEATRRVAKMIREQQPDSVLTFGPDGMTGHADHKAVCAWTTKAFEQEAKPGSSLYYATHTPEHAAKFEERMKVFNVFMEPGTPPKTPISELAIYFVLPDQLRERKLKAILAHVSQMEGMLNMFGEQFFRDAVSEENYRLAQTK
ncbi:MAG: PIG-L deacetylase family protein [Actinomycetota bacterium]